MTTDATIRSMPRPRGELDADTKFALTYAKAFLDRAGEQYRSTVLRALEVGSFAEVSRVTGVSTNTLQRWRREAGR